jgi:hypothetical protein
MAKRDEGQPVERSGVERHRKLIKFVEIDPFSRQWASLKLTEGDLVALQKQLQADPFEGAVVEKGNGLRKLRFVPEGAGKGKSGAYRVFYVAFPDHGTALLLAVISKRVKVDLTPDDVKVLAKFIERIEGMFRKGLIR